MKNIPKPQHCGQDWLDMTPTTGGRICGQCDKVIVDFTRSDWADIERIQKENNNTLCGMYSPAQLAHWGQQVPAKGCSKMAATAAMLVSMSVSAQAFAQTPHPAKEKTRIYGTVHEKISEGKGEPLLGAIIRVKGTETGAYADAEGNYQIQLPDHPDTLPHPVLVFSMIGYQDVEIPLTGLEKGNFRYDALLAESDVHLSVFYVKRPTIWRRIQWRFQEWFRRKES
jgi:CarboxypepD_reg-like domain